MVSDATMVASHLPCRYDPTGGVAQRAKAIPRLFKHKCLTLDVCGENLSHSAQEFRNREGFREQTACAELLHYIEVERRTGHAARHGDHRNLGKFLSQDHRDAVVLTSPMISIGKNWEEAYCARHDCTPTQFRRRVFWCALHRHALPFAPFLLLGNHFSADYDLVAACGRARSMRRIREEIEDHRYHPLNSGWRHNQLAFRISTHRLRRMAREYLPSSSLPAPFSAASK